jgi:thiol-disulfide isomerase/thioredoxin
VRVKNIFYLNRKIRLYGYVSMLFLFLGCLPKFSSKAEAQVRVLEDKGYSTLKEVVNLSPFRNKVVYVDIWGTRCIPCIEEFEFNSALKTRFKNKNVEYLYLAVDYGHSDDKTRWSKMIEDKNLSGYNMFVSKKLYIAVWQWIKEETL